MENDPSTKDNFYLLKLTGLKGSLRPLTPFDTGLRQCEFL